MKFKLLYLALALLFAACSAAGKKQLRGSDEGAPPMELDYLK